MSLKTTIENYKKSKSLYLTIDNKFYQLQAGIADDNEFELNQLIVKVKELGKLLKYINLDDLANEVEEKKIEAIKYNVDVFKEAQYYWSRFFLGAKYAAGLLKPLMHKYISNIDDDTIKEFGGLEKLCKKFISIITHTDNVLKYENLIKRMILGTMTQKEFERIFNTIRPRMSKQKLKESIFNFGKFIKEDFFNPFEEDERFSEKKPIKISDKGGPLLLRKETFNLARVEFSKRPAGESTVIAKTQFAKGEIVEICPVIILGEEAKAVDNLKDLIFEIDRDHNEWALVLGYGSLYRHSEKPNLDYAYNRLTKQMYFITKTPVKHGEELTINYGQDYWMQRMTFNTLGEDPKPSGKPISGKIVSKNESEVQPNASDIQGHTDIKNMSSPQNKANPVISGVAIIGGGQS